MQTTLQLATLGGGCFWCLEAVFQRVKGVNAVVSGYAGGHTRNPNYTEICTGTSGHAEVVQLTYDPSQITYAALLDVFFEIHDPTTLNRQGNDVGTQYRSVIYYHDTAQQQAAEQCIAQLGSTGLGITQPIVTQVLPIPVFYPAEPYHQDYFNQHRNQPYCHMVVNPKVQKLLKRFPAQVK